MDSIASMVGTYLKEQCTDWVDVLGCGVYSRQELAEHAPLIMLDNLMPLYDEEDQAAFSMLVHRWIALGAAIIISSKPSAPLLPAAFPDAHRITSRDLVVSGEAFLQWTKKMCLPEHADNFKDTHGIPALLSALRHVRQPQKPSTCNSFRAVSSGLLRGLVEEPMPQDMKTLMLVMALLGSGSIADLAGTGIVVREDDLFEIQNDYPMFGVSVSQGIFSCIEPDSSFLAEIVARLNEGAPEIASSCIDMLIQRHETERASLGVRFLSDGQLVELARARLPFFVETGAQDIMKRVVEYSRGNPKCPDARTKRFVSEANVIFKMLSSGMLLSARSHPRDMSVKIVLSIAGRLSIPFVAGAQTALRVTSEELSLQHTLPDCAQEVETLSCVAIQGDREKCVALSETILAKIQELDGLPRELLCHFVAKAELLGGAYEHALAWLDRELVRMDWSAPGEGDQVRRTLGCTLLEEDDAFAYLLANRFRMSDGQEKERIREIEDALAFLDSRSFGAFVPETNLYLAVARMVCGQESKAVSYITDALSRYTAMGDTAGQLATLACKAQTELARLEFGHARASIDSVRRLVKKSSDERWSGVVRLLDSIRQCAEGRQKIDDSRLLAYSLADGFHSPGDGAGSADICQRLDRAVLYIVSEDMESAANVIDGIVARGEQRDKIAAYLVSRSLGHKREELLERIGETAAGIFMSGDPIGPVRAGFGQQPFFADVAPLQICLLGSLNIRLNDHCLENVNWGRKKSRELLLQLAIVPGNTLTRKKAAQLLWPESDPHAQSTNLSAILTSARRILGQCNGGPNYLLSAEGSISLNPALVNVDIEVFRTRCREALSIGSEAKEKIFEECSRIEAMYAGGIDESICVEDDGTWKARVEDVKTLFADCMMRAATIARSSNLPFVTLKFVRAIRMVRPDRKEAELLGTSALHFLEEKARCSVGSSQRSALAESRPVPPETPAKPQRNAAELTGPRRGGANSTDEEVLTGQADATGSS